MATRERPADRGTEIGRRAVRDLAQEFRAARRDRGLSLRDVAAAAGISATAVWRFEHELSPAIGVVIVARLLAIVGLDLSARAYPGGSPLRDAGHARVIHAFRGLLHRSLGWATEVPFPRPGDQRAWDGVVRGADWRHGVECETAPRDGQALGRMLEIKRRDGGVDGVLLVVPDTRRVREFLVAADVVLGPHFTVPGRRALELLAAGVYPGGSSVIIVPASARQGARAPGETTDGIRWPAAVPRARLVRGAQRRVGSG